MLSVSLSQLGTPSLEWSKAEIFIPLFLLGTLFVIVGVFMENDGLPIQVVAWGWSILLWGLAMELFASIGQLAIDGEIGNRQRSEIVTLESKLEIATMRATNRRIVAGGAEQKELSLVMSKFAGMPVKVMAYEDDHENRTFAIELMRALQRAGLDTPSKFERVDADQIGFSETGMIITSGSDERSKEAVKALAIELNEKLYFCVDIAPRPQVPDNIRNPAEGSILVFVGYKGSQSHCK
jgi:hypothetical protein